MKFTLASSEILVHPVHIHVSATVLAVVKDSRGHGHETFSEKQNVHPVLKIHICSYDLRLHYDLITLRGIFLANNENRRGKSQRVDRDRLPNFVCIALLRIK